MTFWLFKTEPKTYSWLDLTKEKSGYAEWDGIRNYQARNYMRRMKKGDLAFIYHSVTKPLGIFGIAEVVREAYTDHTQFDPKSKYFDEKSNPKVPRWDMVDLRAIHGFETPILREELKSIPELSEMVLMQKGSRLSIQPVTKIEWNIILKLRENFQK